VGQFLLLGSASLDLIKQSGESLAGRVRYLELFPFICSEVDNDKLDHLWVRGGFPESLFARNGAASLRWRKDFIRTYLERDVLFFAPKIATDSLRRFWTMLAHHHGGLFNAAEFARSLDIDVKTTNRYLDLLIDLLLVRRLEPWFENIGKRLVKSPKIYVRDSGVLHALTSISDKENLLGHKLCGPSFEGWVIENLIYASGPNTQAHFYRTAVGAEIDLLLQFANGQKWAVEIKYSAVPKLSRGFHQALLDLKPESAFVVYLGTERYRVNDQTEAISLQSLAAACQAFSRGQ
jgi:uncharacterized protein